MKKIIEVTENYKTVYRVHPTEVAKFLMKNHLLVVLETNKNYDELPDAVKNSCNFRINNFGLVPEEFIDFENDFVYVSPEIKTSYTIKVSKHLMNLGTISTYNLSKIVREFFNELSYSQENINLIYDVIYNRVISNFKTDRSYTEFIEDFSFTFRAR